jgi:phenylpyruvate tautomerase PptA (4-oxalocrotonate tautomerase family)
MKSNVISTPASRAASEASEVNRRSALVAASFAALAVSGVSCLAAEAGSASFGAPFIEMTFPVGVLSIEQKAALIKRVTEVVNAAMEFPSDLQRRLFVEILETPQGGFGVDGQVVVPRPRQ